jgi:hypothetical protein
MPISYDTGAMTNYDLGRRRNLLDLAKFLDDREQRDPRQQMQMQSRMAQERGNEELRRMRMQKKFADQQRIDDLGAEQAKKGASLRELDKNWRDRIRAFDTQGLYGSPVPLAMGPEGGVTRLDELKQAEILGRTLTEGGRAGGLAGQMEDIYGKETPEEEAARRAFAGVKAGYLSPREKRDIEAREARGLSISEATKEAERKREFESQYKETPEQRRERELDIVGKTITGQKELALEKERQRGERTEKRETELMEAREKQKTIKNYKSVETKLKFGNFNREKHLIYRLAELDALQSGDTVAEAYEKRKKWYKAKRRAM